MLCLLSALLPRFSHGLSSYNNSQPVVNNTYNYYITDNRHNFDANYQVVHNGCSDHGVIGNSYAFGSDTPWADSYKLPTWGNNSYYAGNMFNQWTRGIC